MFSWYNVITKEMRKTKTSLNKTGLRPTARKVNKMDNKEIRIIDKDNTIELTKAFYKKSQYYGSAEFNKLQEVRALFPEYVIKVKSIRKSNSKATYDGLDYEKMESYIAEHDTNGEAMNEYKKLRALTDEAKMLEAKSKPYGSIKKWFLGQFPEYKSFRDEQKNILLNIA